MNSVFRPVQWGHEIVYGPAFAVIAVCPRCDCALLVLSWRGLDVDVCPRCHGFWLDSGELEELLESTGARIDDPLLAFQTAEGHPSPARGPHLCPRCDSRLREVTACCGANEKATLRVDRCPRGHGLWFDSGELRALLDSFPAECFAGGTIAALGELLGAGNRT